jgi:hypothetical protein
MRQDLINISTEFGLKREELDNLTFEDLRTYFNFHHGRTSITSSILVYGFSEKERKEISALARSCKFMVVSKPSEFSFSDTNRVAFICCENLSIIDTAKLFGSTILSKDFLKKFHSEFFTETTEETNIDFLFSQRIPVEYRIATPLSNYNRPFNVHSSSYDIENDNLKNDNVYSVNLHKMTCSCKDFTETNRAQIPVGDIRRLCKHLLSKYEQFFGNKGLSSFSQCVLSEGFGLKKNLKNVFVEGVSLPVVVSYENAEGLWNIFFPNEAGLYRRYGYFPSDESFYYNEKPIGYVKPLRSKLKELQQNLTGRFSNTAASKIQNAQSVPSERANNHSQSNSDYYPPPYQNTNNTNNDKSAINGSATFVFVIIAVVVIIWLFGC